MTKHDIIITILVEKPLQAVWEKWNNPQDIQQWNIPFEDWHCPVAKNDVREGGKFFFRMEHIDGREGFDYGGQYIKVIPYEYIESLQDDNRKSVVEFQEINGNTLIRETFQPENHTPAELQEEFCQSVLNRFKKYTEQIGD